MHLWVFLSVVLTAISISSALDKCYFCEEDDKICLDPVDVAQLPSRVCKPEDFNVPREDNTRTIEGLPEEKPHGFKGIINDMYSKDTSRSATATVTFECIKVDFVKANSTGTYRSCVPKPRDVKSNCDFLKEDLGNEYKITYCEVCHENNCNSAMSVTSRMSILFALIAGSWAITKKILT